MTKVNKQVNEVPIVLASFESKKLNDKQLALRESALLKAEERFTKSLTKSALPARSEIVNLIFDRLSDPVVFTWREHAQLCVAMSDIRSRDGLLRKLHDEAQLRPQICEHLFREITRAHKEWVPPLATVFGGLVWLAGSPEQTRAAIDRALDCDASYSLALLLDIALRHNVPSSVWSASLEAVSFDACLKGAA
jgi:hypothetical protein